MDKIFRLDLGNLQDSHLEDLNLPGLFEEDSSENSPAFVSRLQHLQTLETVQENKVLINLKQSYRSRMKGSEQSSENEEESYEDDPNEEPLVFYREPENKGWCSIL